MIKRFIGACSLVLLTACGGTSDSSSSANGQPTGNVGSLSSGIWQDLHPTNVTYTTNSVNGLTDAAGTYYYRCSTQSCEGISFTVGGVLIGTSVGQSVIHLYDLNGGWANGILSTVSVNRAQFLYALDSDQDPTNGITLPSGLTSSLKNSTLDFTSNNFQTSLNALVVSLSQDSTLDANYRTNLNIPSAADARSLVAQANALQSGVYTESPTISGVNVSTVRQYVVPFPSQFLARYNGNSANLAAVSNGLLRPSLGAGLTFVSGSSSGTLVFQTVSSRGIAVNAPNYTDGVSSVPATVLLSSDAAAAPSMATMTLSSSGLSLSTEIPLTTQQGNAYSGAPTPTGSSGSFNERNLTEALTPVSPKEFDPDGLDPAGITLANDGTYWICDRRGPFLIQVDSAGHTKLRMGPLGTLATLPYVTRLLPAILESRQRNLGCGGLAQRPISGDIVMAVGATLNPGGNTAGSALFTRLVSYQPTSQAIHQYAIALLNGDHNLQILDMAALSDTSFLLLVHFTDAQNNDQWAIRQVSIANATDINKLLLTSGPNSQRDLEYGSLSDITASNVTMAVPTTVLTLNSIGWNRSSLEAMALVDKQTIALMTNSNAGASSSVSAGANGTDPTNYQVDSNGVISPRADLLTPAQWSAKARNPADRQTLFWLISLTNPLTP